MCSYRGKGHLNITVNEQKFQRSVLDIVPMGDQVAHIIPTCMC